MTSDKIATIDFNLYRPSINSGEIDALWIIGTHTLGSSPNDAVSKLYKVKYNTIDEFRASLINFHHLIRHNISEFMRDEAEKKFNLTRDRASGVALDEVTDRWIKSDRTGLIIFGGYGLGKTTYSLHLAKRFSEDYINGKSFRISIRIPLGGMYTKAGPYCVNLFCLEWERYWNNRTKFFVCSFLGNELAMANLFCCSMDLMKCDTPWT